MVKFKEILKKLDLDLDFNDVLLNLDLPIGNIFDHYIYYKKTFDLPEEYECSSSIDDCWTLEIYPNKKGIDDIALELWSFKDTFGKAYFYSGEEDEFILPDW